MVIDTNEVREWRRKTSDGEYLISTRLSLFDHEWVNTAFSTADVYWAKPLPLEQIALMLEKSLNLGLYKVSPAGPAARSTESPSSPRTPSPTMEAEPEEAMEQVGMARFITDFISTAYLSDVYIMQEHRTQGLGKWLIACCKEVLEAHPALRRGMLVTDPVIGKRFYAREMDFYDLHEVEGERIVCMTRKAYKSTVE